MCTYQITLENAQPSSSNPSCGEPLMKSPVSPVTAISPTTTQKRTIRFGDDDDVNRPVKRRIVELADVPMASQMTPEERSTLWMQKADHRATYSDVAEVVRTCQASGDHDDNHDDTGSHSNNRQQRTQDAYVNFAEALATAYNICNEEPVEDSCSNNNTSDNDADDDTKKLPLDRMIVFGTSHTPSRGLESKIIPGLGGHRYKKRQEHILGVLGVQRELRAMKTSDADMAEGLGAVSEYLSQSSRRFARALGAVDGTMALLEYATVNNHTRMEEKETQASCIGAFLSMQALDSIVN